MMTSRLAFAAALLGIVAVAQADGEQKMASIGDLPLSGSGTLLDCRVGYRTYGTMKADGSDVVLPPPPGSSASRATGPT